MILAEVFDAKVAPTHDQHNVILGAEMLLHSDCSRQRARSRRLGENLGALQQEFQRLNRFFVGHDGNAGEMLPG